MSFFIRGKSKRKKTNEPPSKKRKPAFSKKEHDDDEITSSDEDEGITVNGDAQQFESDDENETAHEKKLRLTKVYLQEIERIEKERLGNENEEVDKRLISKRLREDHLKETGQYRNYISQNYAPDKVDVRAFKSRQQRNVITCLCISPDDKYLFTGSKEGVVVKWNINDSKPESKIPFSGSSTGHKSKVMAIAISSDSNYLATGEEASNIHIWNPSNLNHIKTFTGHKKLITGLAFKLNSHILYSCSADRSVKLWNLDEMMYVETLFGHQDAISAIDTLYKDRVITAGSRDCTLRIWKITEESQLIYNGHSGSIDCVKLVNDDHFISGGDDGQISLWTFTKKKPVFTIKNAHGFNEINEQPNWICSLATITNTDVFASGSNNGLIKLWKLSKNFRAAELLFDIQVNGFINSLAFTSDGQKLMASCGRDHRFGRWTTFKDVKNCVKVITLMDLQGFVLFKQGAEAKLHRGVYLGLNVLAKERFTKKYRQPELDEALTRERIKAESRAIVRCKSAGIRTPVVYLVDFERRTIFLEYFEDNLCVKDFIERCSDDGALKALGLRIGELIGRMHASNVVHGDLTSSNILLIKKTPAVNFELSNLDLVLIDFGLAKTDSSVEDKGVDLYVLQRALASTHSVAETIFENILKGYKKENRNHGDVLEKYEDVKMRGRKRTMIG